MLSAQDLRDHQSKINDTYEKALMYDIETKLQKVKDTTDIPISNYIQIDVYKGMQEDAKKSIKSVFRKRGFNVEFIIDDITNKMSCRVSW